MQFQFKVALAFSAAIVILICLSALAIRKISDDQADQQWVHHTHVVLETLDDLLLTVSTASKTGASQSNGFSSLPEPSAIDKERLRFLVGVLRELTRENPRQQDALNRMASIIETAWNAPGSDRIGSANPGPSWDQSREQIWTIFLGM